MSANILNCAYIDLQSHSISLHTLINIITNWRPNRLKDTKKQKIQARIRKKASNNNYLNLYSPIQCQATTPQPQGGGRNRLSRLINPPWITKNCFCTENSDNWLSFMNSRGGQILEINKTPRNNKKYFWGQPHFWKNKKEINRDPGARTRLF